jgi:hypothetical protein
MLEKKFLTSQQRELVLRIAREYKQGTMNIHWKDTLHHHPEWAKIMDGFTVRYMSIYYGALKRRSTEEGRSMENLQVLERLRQRRKNHAASFRRADMPKTARRKVDWIVGEFGYSVRSILLEGIDLVYEQLKKRKRRRGTRMR